MQASVGHYQPLAGILGLAFIPGQDSGEGRQSSGSDVPVDRTGSQMACFLFPLLLKQRGCHLSSKWILEDNLLALSLCVKQGVERTAALGAFSPPVLLLF